METTVEKKKRPTASLAQRINIMRASVMGANDGILSVAGIVIGVAGATNSPNAIFLAGIAGMLAGTISMAMGEWVSVSTQRDSEQRAIQRETVAVAEHMPEEITFIKDKYMQQGISAELSEQAAHEMMAGDPLYIGVRERYGFDPKVKTSAIGAAVASMISFPLGSILPLVAITFFPARIRIIATIISVIIALSVTGFTAAALGNANRYKATLRNVVAGILTMAVTYAIGLLFAR
ncbi:VIT1/CCC1 transporter family protein [Furfurilactobacillus sp. WILCCON 0119]|uniref:VIT1/CCC1 transporter family protein n=1 Tax=Furfurilactobacillus entadae TaxID=2922307 RepID=UPI0035EBA205